MKALSATLLVVLVLAAACGGGGEATGDSPAEQAGGGSYEADLRAAGDAVWATADWLEQPPRDRARLRPELDRVTEDANAAVIRIEQTTVPGKALDANQRLLAGLWFTRDALEDARLTAGDPGGGFPSAELARARDGVADAEAALGQLEKLGYDVARRP